MAQLAKNGAWTGGEMFWKSNDPKKGDSVNGPLDVAIQNGINSGMKWVEVYQDDIAAYGSAQPSALYEDVLKDKQQMMME
jgi:hypothetical protein